MLVAIGLIQRRDPAATFDPASARSRRLLGLWRNNPRLVAMSSKTRFASEWLPYRCRLSEILSFEEKFKNVEDIYIVLHHAHRDCRHGKWIVTKVHNVETNYTSKRKHAYISMLAGSRTILVKQYGPRTNLPNVWMGIMRPHPRNANRGRLSQPNVWKPSASNRRPSTRTRVVKRVLPVQLVFGRRKEAFFGKR